jgi:diguanylate cyclase (GGDEF)-like protein
MKLPWRVTLGLPAALMLAVALFNALLLPLVSYGTYAVMRNDISDEFVNSVREQTRQFSQLLENQSQLNNAHDLMQDWLLSGQIVFGEFVPTSGPVVRATFPQRDVFLNYAEDFSFGEHGDDVYFISAPVHGSERGLRGVLRLGFDERPVVQRIDVLYYQTLMMIGAYLALSLLAAWLGGWYLRLRLLDLHAAARRPAAEPAEPEGLRLADCAMLDNDIAHLQRELRRRDRALQLAAWRETLVSMTDRRLFLQHVRAAIEQGGRGQIMRAVFLIDVDAREQPDEPRGPDFQEELLQAVVARLLPVGIARAPQRSGGEQLDFEFIARLGKRELGVLLPGEARREDTPRIAERLLSAAQEPVMVSGDLATLRMSIGIALYPQDGLIAEAVVRNAEIAMLEAKRRGGDRYCSFAELAGGAEESDGGKSE